MHLIACCRHNMGQLTLALCGDDASCMVTLTVSGKVDE